MEHLNALIAFCVVILLASLLVTVFTQMVVFALNLRGKNLFWGLKILLKEVHPSSDQVIKNVLKKVMTHDLVSPYKHRKAPVIRVEELSQILIRIARSPDDYKLGNAEKEWIEKLIDIDQAKIAELLKKVPDDLETVIRESLVKAHRRVMNYLQKSREKLVEIEMWFDNVTDRISGRFSFYSRLISIGASLVLAVAMQLDAIRLVQNVYVDENLRAQLVVSSDLVLKQSQRILDQPSLYNKAMGNLREEQKEMSIPVAPSLSNRDRAQAWIRNSIADKAKADMLVQRYNEILNQVTKEQLDDLGREAFALRRQLSELGLKIISKDYSWDLGEWPPSKYFGILISVIFLSLGAPFWFNALKNLSNLRSKVMQSEEEERLKRQ